MPNPELSAGALDRRVTLLKPIYSEYEDEITGWTPVGGAYASITPAAAQETNEAGRTVAVSQISVVIRYRPDIDARWRVQDGSHTYEIDGLWDVQRRGAQLQLKCKEIE